MTASKRKAKRAAVEELMVQEADLLKAVMKEALQEVLEAQMSEQLGAAPGERTAERLGYRAGYYPIPGRYISRLIHDNGFDVLRILIKKYSSKCSSISSTVL